MIHDFNKVMLKTGTSAFCTEKCYIVVFIISFFKLRLLRLNITSVAWEKGSKMSTRIYVGSRSSALMAMST